MRARDCVWPQPATLSPVDQSSQLKGLRMIGQTLLSKSKFGAGAGVIGISPVEMPAQRQVRFPRIRHQPKCRIYGGLCQGQASGSVVGLSLMEPSIAVINQIVHKA